MVCDRVKPSDRPAVFSDWVWCCDTRRPAVVYSTILSMRSCFCHLVRLGSCGRPYAPCGIYFGQFSDPARVHPSCITACGGAAVWATELRCVSKSVRKEIDASHRLPLHFRITEWNSYNTWGYLYLWVHSQPLVFVCVSRCARVWRYIIFPLNSNDPGAKGPGPIVMLLHSPAGRCRHVRTH